ncbi:ABC transporter permease [Halovivax limisalsi]|uniref:ABC transporter permease n=1 Tax=Halovivax limisalsi TaxID=1453760 RepID=UPI001FFCD4F5|nr:ABC transporter permease [Halovivax limisalsi]
MSADEPGRTSDDCAPPSVDPERTDTVRTWLRRRIGWLGLAVRRTWTRLRRTAPRRSLAAVGGVAIAVALLLVVSGLSLGLVAPATGLGAQEYWVSPADSSGSPLVATGGPSFGSVEEGAERMRAIDGVEGVSPVRTDVVRTDDSTFVLAVGVDPSAGVDLYGIDPSALRTQEGAILSDGAAAELSVGRGESIAIGGTSYPVVDVGEADGLASATPLVVFDLSTAQSLAGAPGEADRFVVRGDGVDPAALESVYPSSEARSSDELAMSRLGDADLPLALSLAALVVSVLVGTLFVAVTTAMDVLSERRAVETLRAIGVPRRRQRGLFAVQAFVLATLGGVAGTALGIASIRGGNALARELTGLDGPLSFHPLLLVYGPLVAWVIAGCSLPSVAIAIRQVDADGDRGG